jgi:hypothetical protein
MVKQHNKLECVLKRIETLIGSDAGSGVAGMDENWSARNEYDTEGGQRIQIECNFHGLNVHEVFLIIGADTYRLLDGNNFNQWMYLVVPSQYVQTVTLPDTAFVNRMTLRADAGNVRSLNMNVNYVYIGDNAGGFRIGKRDYTLKFQK